MDSRDIKEEPSIPKDNKYLESIYEMQKQLLDSYISIEGLPKYPLNVNTKTNQLILKDFTSRVIEELAEAYESLLLVEELTITKQNWFTISSTSIDSFVECMNHLQNASEEMADALHFFIELLIYTNIQPEDINSYIESKLPKNKRQNFPNTLEYGMALGKQWLSNMNQIPDVKRKNLVNLIHKYEQVKVDFNIPEYNIKLLHCGEDYNYELYNSYKSYLWDITYELNISRNFLKNKPWKQSQMMTNESAYQEEIVKSFILFLGTLNIMGVNGSNLYYIYFKKNKINQFRIKSKY